MRYRRSFCGGCGQDRAEWLNPDGTELKDPPMEVIGVLCPSCEMLEDWRTERADQGAKQHGIHPAFRRLPELEPPASIGD